MSDVTIWLAYLHLILTHSKRQGQGHAYFDCEYLAKDDRWANVTIAPNIMLHVDFQSAYLELIMTYSKGHFGHRNGILLNILVFLYSLLVLGQNSTI